MDEVRMSNVVNAIIFSIGKKAEVEDSINSYFKNHCLPYTCDDLDGQEIMLIHNTIANCSGCNKIERQQVMWMDCNYYNQDAAPLFCDDCADMLFGVHCDEDDDEE